MGLLLCNCVYYIIYTFWVKGRIFEFEQLNGTNNKISNERIIRIVDDQVARLIHQEERDVQYRIGLIE